MKNTKTVKISPVDSACIRLLYQKMKLRGKSLLQQFPQYSKATIYRHATKPVGVPHIDKRHLNRGRPPALDARDGRSIMRELPRIRKEHGQYTVKKVMVETGLENKVSRRTVSRFLNKKGLRYLHTRKKGLMNALDLKRRVKFAKDVKKTFPEIWTEGISFYLDGVGFVHKTNPRDAAMSPKGMAWRAKSQGLDLGYTSKGKKEGVNGNVAKYIVCIAYSVGVIWVEKYEKMNGQYFKQFITKTFKKILRRSNVPEAKSFLQDGDPSQNAKVCQVALEKMGIIQFAIPPRSPDLNPIENLFNNVRKQLGEDAIVLNIRHKTYEEFCTRVEQTLWNYNRGVIDRTIESMQRRMDLIIKGNGKRLKY